jgi:hypothetical protein
MAIGLPGPFVADGFAPSLVAEAAECGITADSSPAKFSVARLAALAKVNGIAWFAGEIQRAGAPLDVIQTLRSVSSLSTRCFTRW